MIEEHAAFLTTKCGHGQKSLDIANTLAEHSKVTFEREFLKKSYCIHAKVFSKAAIFGMKHYDNSNNSCITGKAIF